MVFNTLRNEIKIFCGFRVFEYAMAKIENPETPEIDRKISKSENTHC